MRRLLLLLISLVVPWTMASAEAKDTSHVDHTRNVAVGLTAAPDEH